MPASTDARVAAVLVTFQPEPSHLRLLLEQLQKQVSLIVWMDNGSRPRPSPHSTGVSTCRLIPLHLPGNIGLAAAQNRGIEQALGLGATHVLLLDQDSFPSEDMVQELLAALRRYPDAAALGPQIVADRPVAATVRPRRRTGLCRPDSPVLAVDRLIASGCIIPAERLLRVGLMREDWFIDWVDTEWCWRAADLGYRLYQVPSALLQHTIGEDSLNLLGRRISVHAPWRHYYQARNGLLMLRATRFSLSRWLYCGPRQIARFAFFALFVPPRRRYAYMWLKGWWDGLRNRRGQGVLPQPSLLQ